MRNQGSPQPRRSKTTARGRWVAAGACVTLALVSIAGVSSPVGAQSTDTTPATAVPVVTTTSVPAVTTTVAPALTPSAYVADALAFIERYAYHVPSIDWPAVRTRAELRASSAATIEDTYPIIIEAVKALNDRHSSFTKPPDAVVQSQGQYTGFGFLASMPSKVVLSIAPGSPAEKGGLRIGDRIDAVDGKAPKASAGVLVIARRPDGTFAPTVVLRVVRKGVKKPLNLKLTRGTVTLVSIPASTPPPQVVIPPSFGYLEVPGIVGDAAAQKGFATQIQELIRNLDDGSRCGWIVDLRKNRGGYIYAMLAGLAPLVGEGPAGGSRSASGAVTAWTYRAGAVFAGEEKTVSVDAPYTLRRPGSPVAVLTSGLTASAGEATTIFFRGLPFARSFGEPTIGLTTFNVRKTLADGAFLDITAAVDVDRAGVAYDGPIPPDEPIALDWAAINTGKDAAIEAASSWLRSQPGCANPGT